MEYRYRDASEMKDSGVEWIGKIPNDWTKTKVGYLANYINGYPFKPTQWSNVGYKIIRIQNLTNQNQTFNMYNGEIDKKYIIVKGDILISWSATLDTFIWNLNEKAVLNQHIFKVEPYLNTITKEYYLWLAKWFILEMGNSKHGSTMQHVTKEIFEKFVVYIPKIKEQKKLSDFLDKKASQFDLIISKKEALIEKLEEAKKSLISEVVTGKVKVVKTDDGYDLVKRSSDEMKDSGIEWLGEIPKDWKFTRLKYIINTTKGYAFKTELFKGTGIPIIKASDIKNGTVLKGSICISEELYNQYKKVVLN